MREDHRGEENHHRFTSLSFTLSCLIVLSTTEVGKSLRWSRYNVQYERGSGPQRHVHGDQSSVNVYFVIPNYFFVKREKVTITGVVFFYIIQGLSRISVSDNFSKIASGSRR